MWRFLGNELPEGDEDTVTQMSPCLRLSELWARSLRPQSDFRPLVVDAVVLRIGAGEVRAGVMLERIRAAEPRGQLLLGARGNDDAKAALLAEKRTVEEIGPIAQNDLRGPNIVQVLFVRPRIRQRAIRDRRTAVWNRVR